MSLVPYDGSQLPTRWSLDDFGLYLSFQAHRMYFWLREVAPVVVKAQLKQMRRNVINNLPFVSEEAKRDIKRWVGDYDPSHYLGYFYEVWVDHNAIENGYRGMRIHAKFNVKNLKSVACTAAAYFYLSTGIKLKDFNNSYYATDGQVAVSNPFTPNYDNCDFHDLILFMPISELHLAAGYHDLCFHIDLYDNRSLTRFIVSQSYYFSANINI